MLNIILGLLKKSSPSKIIFISSKLAFLHNLSLDNLNYPEDQVGSLSADCNIYANSKLCSIIAADELSKKLYGTDVTVYSVHPGLVYTDIFSKYAKNRSCDNIFYSLFNAIVLKPFAKVSFLFFKKNRFSVLCFSPQWKVYRQLYTWFCANIS